MTQKRIFVDAHYWIALLSPRDQYHENARFCKELVEQSMVVTSEMVLTEVLDAFADKGEHLRAAAGQMVDIVLSDNNTEVVPQSSEMFMNAFILYKGRLDKQWHLTDCASMCIMKTSGIQEVITGDRHFTQAGFIALLRR